MSLPILARVRSFLATSARSRRRRCHMRMVTESAETLEVRRVPTAVSLGVIDGNTLKLDAHDANNTRSTAAITEVQFQFGLHGDTVFIGNWNGNGPGPVAVRQPGVNGAPNDGLIHWYFDTNGDAVVDKHVAFGLAGDKPVVGDWDGNGRDEIGVTRKSGGAGVANDGLLNWFLSSSSSPTGYFHRKYGFSNDTPVVGNWDGRGGDDLGVVRPDTQGNLTWMQDRNGDTLPDRIFNFGRVGDRPVAGDWDGNGTDNVGVTRTDGTNSLQWILDTNGNSTPDVVRKLNATGVSPLVVDWGNNHQSESSSSMPIAGTPVAVRLRRAPVESSIDLRDGQIASYGSGPVSIVATLQNGESITAVTSPLQTLSHVKTLNGDDLAHQIGRPQGTSWTVNVNDTPNQFLAYGPYMTLSEGDYSAKFTLEIDNNSADNGQILTIDVYDVDAGKIVASMPIRRGDFETAGSRQVFELQFNAVAGHRMEFRTFWHGGAYVRQWWVSLYKSIR